MNLPDARIWFRYQCKTTKYIKGNTSSAYRDNMDCRYCTSGEEETQEHMETWKSTSEMQQRLNLNKECEHMENNKPEAIWGVQWHNHNKNKNKRWIKPNRQQQGHPERKVKWNWAGIRENQHQFNGWEQGNLQSRSWGFNPSYWGPQCPGYECRCGDPS